MSRSVRAAQPLPFLRLLWRTHCRWQSRVIDLVLVALAGLDAALNYPPPRDWHFYASLGAAAVLLLRRRWPRTVLIATLPGLYAGNALIAAMVGAYTVARTERPVRHKALAALVVAAGAFVPWPITGFAKETLSDLVQQLIYAVMLGTGPVMLGLLAQTRKDLSDRVAELATVRDHERALHAQTVIARERARIAREMHDVVSHQAGLIAVQAGALEVTARDPDVKEVAGTLRGLAVATLEELRSMILVLRAAGAGPTELAPQPTLADLPALVSASEVNAELRIDGADGRELPEPVERAAYRTVQEALTNVRKHAPGAATTVTVVVAQESLRVCVRNGPASAQAPRPDLPGGGHGIVGLRERATLLGGTLAAAPEPDGGFAVRLELPYGRTDVP
ncbi:sensor histidine kinase [Streptantibioticus rubrisoli]|uniref:histidine kinase n=1 Tax=Streptantibioticus rubrisoli TaxID=1387313 RepID=A0ABT1P861_9ACTN|nr:histidine kinase [Streptantibioticus rubrisoli]MCQ4041558.1 histidine kinase [Streptantibioticus rubrisoli]